MTYDEMLDRYGSDKPDLRYGMELVDPHRSVRGQRLQRVREGRRRGRRRSRRSRAPGGGQLSRKELDKLVEDAKGRGAAGLVWIVVEDDGAVRSPVEKFLATEEIEGIVARTGATPGDLVCIVADVTDRVNVALDGLRRDLAVRLDLIPEGAWAFCWYFEAAAVRVERGGGTVDREPPPVHGAAHRRPGADQRRRRAPTT